MDERVLDRLLGPLERAVMEVVWSTGPVTVREVHERVGRDRRLAYTTVLTVMSRLAQKGLLGRRERGGHHVYRARMGREEFVDDASRREVDRVIADFGDAAIAHFLEAASAVHPDLMQRLRKLALRSRAKPDRR